MKTNLSENRHLDANYAENDDFGFAAKADAIKSFLEYNVNDLLSNKMLALYGNWGSGKTSLMRCISDTINKQLYHPVFFEAWQFEKDENLALSLCDLLVGELQTSNSELVDKFKENAYRVLKGFVSGINIKFGGKLFGAEAEFSGKDFMEGTQRESKPDNKSAYALNEEFKKVFREVEKLLLEKAGAQRIIIFVDDLDRCEPEHVLNLITALKLFFTYGENTIFFCALDKEAVTKAVVTKYQDVVKSDEYLEKVFDISFQMPKSFSLQRMLERHFGGRSSYHDIDFTNAGFINDFFLAIRFTNPRHIKKVLNKYQIVRAFKQDSKLSAELKEFLPNLLDSEGNGDIFETVFCLFFIVIYEFYPEQFREIEDYERKLKKYAEPIRKRAQENGSNVTLDTAINNLKPYEVRNFKGATFGQILTDGRTSNSINFVQFLYLFTPATPEKLRTLFDNGLEEFEDYFQDDSKLTLFCKFLIRYNKVIFEHEFGDYILWNYFNMCNILL